MKKINSKAIFYVIAALIITISLSFTFLKFDISIFRFNSAFVHFCKTAAHYFKVVFLHTEKFGTSYGVSESVKFIDLKEFIPFDIEAIMLKFEMYWENFFVLKHFLIYSFEYIKFVIKAVIYIVLSMIIFIIFETIFEALYFEFSENPSVDSKPLRAYKNKVEPLILKAYN